MHVHTALTQHYNTHMQKSLSLEARGKEKERRKKRRKKSRIDERLTQNTHIETLSTETRHQERLTKKKNWNKRQQKVLLWHLHAYTSHTHYSQLTFTRTNDR